jgi:hypothetical protein
MASRRDCCSSSTCGQTQQSKEEFRLSKGKISQSVALRVMHLETQQQ